MKTTGMMAAALALSLFGTGCATKKYVAKTVAPVEQRVGGTETKNTEQDKAIAEQVAQTQELDRSLSRTKEQLTDTDAKATRAGEAARLADMKAGNAQQAANGAQQAADNAHQVATNAERGVTRLGHTVEAMNHYQMSKTETILFGLNQDTLTAEGTQSLDEFAKQASGFDRYVIEIQGFTDKSGAPSHNEALSQRRAQAVARYFANQYKIPVRNISMLGSGYAMPVADDKTRDGRKQNRRVEIRLWIPETESSRTVATGGGAE